MDAPAENSAAVAAQGRRCGGAAAAAAASALWGVEEEVGRTTSLVVAWVLHVPTALASVSDSAEQSAYADCSDAVLAAWCGTATMLRRAWM